MAQEVVASLGLDTSQFDPKIAKSIEQLESLYANLKKIEDSDIKIGSKGGLTELNAKVKQLENSVKSYQIQLDKLEKTKQQQLKTEQETIKVITLEDKALQQNIKTKQQQLTYEQQLAKEKAKGLSQANAEAKIAAQLTNEYAILSKSLKDAEQRYYNLAIATNFSGEAQEEALQEALKIRAVLDKLDTNLRNNQRNVGNYKSAFDGLGMSFTQVARELPSLAINTQTFLLAISNNLPMVFDEIGKARTEIAALRAEGQETPSLFSRIAKSALSLQVGLSLLITLFTLFGGKLIDAIGELVGYDNATEKAAEATAKLQKAQLELIKTQEELNKLFADPINDVDRLSKTLAIYQSLGKSRGDQLEIEKKILEINSLNANQEFITSEGFGRLEEYRQKLSIVSSDLLALKELQAKGEDSNGNKLDKSALENLDKVVARKQIEFDLAEELFKRQKKIVQDNFNTQVELDSKLNEIKIYNAEQQLSREVEQAKIEAETVINNNERILADERNFERERNQALIEAAAQRKRIIDADLRTIAEDPANTNADGTETAALTNARKKAAADKLEIDKKLAEDQFKNSEEFRKRRLAAELEINKAELTLAEAKYKSIADSEANSFVDRTEAYAEYYRKAQELLQKDYDYQKATKVMTQEELLALDADFSKKQQELAIKSRKEIADIYVNDENNVLSLAESQDKLRLSKEELSLYRSLRNKTEFAKKQADLELKAQRQSIENDTFTQNEIIASALTTEVQKKAAAQRILDNQTKLNQLELTEEQKKDQAKLQIKEIYYNLELKAVETFFSLYKKLADAQYERRLEQLREEARVSEENYRKEISNIQASTLSEQEKAAQITILTAQQAAKKEEIARKEREEKIKQAKTDKAIGIAKIIVETALAVVHALTTGDPYTAYARALLVGAAGAAELAVAVATPIPSYFKETDNHPGGPARFGEVPEVVSEPGKQPYVQWTETIGMLPKGTKVKHLTSDDVMAAAGGAMVNGMADRVAIAERAEQIRQDNKELIQAVVLTGREMVRAVKSQRHSTVINIHSRWAEKIDKEVRR